MEHEVVREALYTQREARAKVVMAAVQELLRDHCTLKQFEGTVYDAFLVSAPRVPD